MDYLIALLGQLLQDKEAAAGVFVALMGSAVFIVALAGISLASGFTDPIRRRMGALNEAKSASSTRFRMKKWMEPLVKYAMPRDKRELNRVGQSLLHAGFRKPSALRSFYSLKTLLTLGMPLVALMALSWFPGITTMQAAAITFCAAAVGLLAPNYVLHQLVQRRQLRIMQGLPDALDLLVVCTEAGLGLKAAMQRVADELVVSHPDLAEEFALVGIEARAGVEREETLRNLADRTGIEDIRGLVSLLVQSLRFGTSIADALRIYSEEFRDRRMQKAEEQAAKIGTKMIFPLVFCLFPAFFLVAIGPAIVGVLAYFR